MVQYSIAIFNSNILQSFYYDIKNDHQNGIFRQREEEIRKIITHKT